MYSKLNAQGQSHRLHKIFVQLGLGKTPPLGENPRLMFVVVLIARRRENLHQRNTLQDFTYLILLSLLYKILILCCI